jgi:type VI protein secretion system component Hcp
MRLRFASLAGAASAGLLAFAAHADPTVGGYLAIDGMKPPAAQPSAQSGGWSPDATAINANWLPVLSYKLTEASPSGGGGHGGGGATSSFSITRQQDAASPLLLEASAKGWPWGLAILDVPGGGGNQIVYKLTNVRIGNYSAGTGGGGVSQESFTLSFQAMNVVDDTSQPTINGETLHIPALGATLVHAPPPQSAPSGGSSQKTSSSLTPALTPWGH